MLEITLDKVRLHIEGHWRIEGSVFRQDRRSIMEKVDVRLDVESGADAKLIAAALRNARSGCHTESALRNPTPVLETVTLNGGAFEVEAFPAETVRRQPGGGAG